MTAHNFLTTCLVSAAVAGMPSVEAADTFGSGANQFIMDFVSIGLGSTPDTTGYGVTTDDFRIGVNEVSENMIAAYNALSGGPAITLDSRGPDQPATNVTWNEAARFVNWLNTSTLGPGTEAYNFTTGGATQNITPWMVADPGYDAANPFRNTNAFYFLPSEDEWYRAAYYDPNADVYYNYATGSDTAPTSVSGGTAPGTAVYGTQPAPADVANAGGLSIFGTRGQGGNVFEWVESGYTAPNDSGSETRVVRGGAYNSPASNLTSDFRFNAGPNSTFNIVGFRVASVVPEPSEMLIVMIGAIGVLTRRLRG